MMCASIFCTMPPTQPIHMPLCWLDLGLPSWVRPGSLCPQGHFVHWATCITTWNTTLWTLLTSTYSAWLTMVQVLDGVFEVQLWKRQMWSLLLGSLPHKIKDHFEQVIQMQSVYHQAGGGAVDSYSWDPSLNLGRWITGPSVHGSTLILWENKFCCTVKDVLEERDLSSQKKTSQKFFVKVWKLRKTAWN